MKVKQMFRNNITKFMRCDQVDQYLFRKGFLKLSKRLNKPSKTKSTNQNRFPFTMMLCLAS